MSINIIFFGSTSDSVIVLSRLVDNKYSPVAVVTQPPSPVGRKQIITSTPVELLAKELNIPICSFANNKEKPWLFENEEEVVNTLSTFKPDLLISASYGQKIPDEVITNSTFGGINIHPSLLPRWRGGDPVPWAILSGDKQTGVSVVQLSTKFDRGLIYAQKKIVITKDDRADPLRTKLFAIGAELFLESLSDILSGKIKGTPQKSTDAPYARRFVRDDGFEPWMNIVKSFTDNGEATRIDRKLRALSPWPGVWTLLRQGFHLRQGYSGQVGGRAKIEKRVKIIKAHLEQNTLIIDTVQVEGKNPVAWKQFENSYTALK